MAGSASQAGQRYAARNGARYALVAMMAAAVGALAVQSAGPGEAAQDELFLTPHSFVVLADRPVCSLLDSVPSTAHILGQDGGTSVEADGHIFWSFNDTRVLQANGIPLLIPNNLASTDDRDASDCMSLAPKTAGGTAAPTLTREGGENGVFPSGMVSVEQGYVHFLYASSVPDPSAEIHYRIQGFGLARFDTTALSGERLLGGQLIWNDDSFPGGHLDEALAIVHDGYVYALLRLTLPGLRAGTMLARTPADALEQADFAYWSGTAWAAEPPDISTEAGAKNALLWIQPIGMSAPSVAYNGFLGKWVAVFTSGYVHLVDARVADDITGPWTSEPPAPVIDCLRFLPLPQTSYICYMGQQHTVYERDGGRTIFVTWNNGNAYQVYLHEIRLGAPVYQWSNDSGEVDYGPIAGSPGFSQDGVAFYASDTPIPGLSAIHRWRAEAGTYRLAATAPDGSFSDGGIAFYAPLDHASAGTLNALYAPVYRWSNGTDERYSALDLRSRGYVVQERAFYGACPDSDRDSKTDCQESFKAEGGSTEDTDGDGLSDSFEAKMNGCDPMIANDDVDGVSVSDELTSGTNPCLWDSGFWGCDNAPVHPVECSLDTDGDGCADAWERGPNPQFGGRRDPGDPWDYFNPTGDGRNRTDDIIAVVMNYFVQEASPAYSTAFDRGGRTGPNAWNLAPPDGRILVDDILAAVGSYLNDCP